MKAMSVFQVDYKVRVEILRVSAHNLYNIGQFYTYYPSVI
jgi:hypothetical protein